jgi:hypothetical protein
VVGNAHRHGKRRKPLADNQSLLRSKIASRLHELFDGRISMTEFTGKSEEHQEPFFLSRALAALSLTQAADLTPDQAAACITDCGADDGIDAVFVDDKRKLIFFVQSKWITGSKSNTDGRADLVRVSANPDFGFQRRYKSQSNRVSGVAVNVVGKHGEFIAAEPRQDITWSRSRPKALRDHLQDAISEGVAVQIIDPLEVV